MQTLLGGGLPLDPALRETAEASLGVGLGHVRLHTGGAADDAARGLNARAFLAGNNIVLGRGADHESLAHELIHVAQQARPGRGPGERAEREAGRLAPELLAGTGAIRLAEAIGPGIHRQADVESAGQSKVGPPSFSAEVVDVATMTNEKLNVEALRVDDWLRAHVAGDNPDLPEYWKLARKLRAERHARVAGGHVWLATVKTETPIRLIGLKAYGKGFHAVVEIDLKTAFGAPSRPGMLIMTEDQFRVLLASQGLSVSPAGNEPGPGQLSAAPTYPSAPLNSSDVQGPAAHGQPYGTAQKTLQAATSFGTTAPSVGPNPGTSAPDPGSTTGVVTMVVGGAVNPKDIHLVNPFAKEYQKQNWPGKMGEASFQGKATSGFGLNARSTNNLGWTDYFQMGADGQPIVHDASEQNYPVSDFITIGGRPIPKVLGVKRISVKTSQGTPSQRARYYRSGLESILDVGKYQSAFEKQLTNQPGLSGTSRLIDGAPNPAFETAKKAIIAESYIAVNADEVELLQSNLRNAVGNWKHDQYRRIYGGELAQNPVRVERGGSFVEISNVDQVNNNTFGLPPEKLNLVKLKTGANVARRVLGMGLTTKQLTGMAADRQNITLPAGDVARIATPQYVSRTKAGPGLKGAALAAGRSGAQGAFGAVLIELETTLGKIAFDEADHPDWETELVSAGLRAAGPGAIAGATDQAVVAGGTRYLLSGGAPNWLKPGGVKFAGGGAGAGVVELLSMLVLEERPHSGSEYMVRIPSAIFKGGVATYVGAAATTGFIGMVWGSAAAGGAAGTIVPGWGNVLGFVIGLAVGVGTYLALDEVLPGGKEAWDQEWEQGFGKMWIPPAVAVIDDTAVYPGLRPQRPLFEPPLTMQRERAAEEGLIGSGTPFAAGVDDRVIPAGYGLRASEQLDKLER
jgi:hypothetical protein